MTSDNERTSRSQDDQEQSSTLARLIPSLITSLRLFLLPVVVEMISHRSPPLFIALVLAVMGITDFLDGFVARRLGVVTTFGKVFDPASDRVVVIVVAAALTLDGLVPLALAIPLLVREAAVSLIVGYLAIIRHRRVDVVWVGKAGTFALLVALPFLVFSLAASSTAHLLYLIGVYIAGAGTLALYLAGYDYVKVLVATLGKNAPATAVEGPIREEIE